MKKIFVVLLFAFVSANTQAQKVVSLDDFGRIVLNTYVSNQAKIPKEAKSQLETKLMQIATNYGMAGSSANPRFVISADVSITTKDIVAGPPQMIAQNLDLTLYIGDAIENKVYSNLIISVKGVGTNENKAFIDAIKQMSTKNNTIEKFLEEAKTKIVSYYTTQCDFINQKANSLKTLGKYEEAIYTLSIIPEVCKDCYTKALQEMSEIYTAKINAEANTLLSKANTAWASNPNEQGANQAISLVQKINPKSKNYAEALQLLKIINAKIVSDEQEKKRKEEEYEKKQQELISESNKQQVEMEKFRINAYKEIALEYAKHQPAIIYKNIYWR